MTDLQWLLLIAAMFATLLPGSIVLLAFKVRGMITVTVTTPPVTVNQAPITVQAPTALLPERVQTTLDAIDAKLAPPKATLVPADQIETVTAEIVEEGRRLGEHAAQINSVNGHKLAGAEKRAVAFNHIKSRLEALNVPFDAGQVALRLESSVAKAKEPK